MSHQNQIERRYFTQPVTVQDEGIIEGYAAVFGQASDDLGGFVEIIEPGFFDAVLADDVRSLWQHDPAYVLGRTTAGTLALQVDSTGLRYVVNAPATQWAQDALISMRRGDVSQSSFAFAVAQDRWEQRDGTAIRHLVKAARLMDVSPVTYPAYPQTTAEARHTAEALRAQHLADNQQIAEAETRARLANRYQQITLAEMEI